MINAVLVAMGGAAGALLRYGMVLLVKPHSPAFPSGTLACNLAGCLAIGFLNGWINGGPAPREPARLLLMVGLLGGFTTFSSLGLETVELLDAGRWRAALAYVVASTAGGIGLALAGYLLTAPTVTGRAG